MWILRNLALQVASVLLQVLSRDVIRGVNGSLKQRHFPGPEFCRPISVLSRGSIHHGYGRLCLALQQPAIIAPSRSRGPRALWLVEKAALVKFCSFILYPSLRTTNKRSEVSRDVGETGKKLDKASQLFCFIWGKRIPGNQWKWYLWMYLWYLRYVFPLTQDSSGKWLEDSNFHCLDHVEYWPGCWLDWA